MTLQEFFAEHPKAALGCSGGVDSSYLLWAAVNAGADIAPYYIQTAFQPAFELEDAQRLCAQIGVKLNVIRLDALADPRVAANPANRCYYCKVGLFGALRARAKADGYDLLLDGTNASDDAGDRPGMKALREMEVRSPLRECGLTKAMIRQESRKAGLFTWDKPAYACLATRVPPARASRRSCWPPRSAPRAGCSRRATRTSASACWTAAPACSSRQISFPGRWPSTTRSSRP